MWISGRRNIVRQQPILKINKMSLKFCKNNKQKPIWFLVLQMEHCANFTLHNKSQKALLGMFILCFYPDFIFALNCDNSLTVFMLKVSCLCHERRFSSIQTRVITGTQGYCCKLYEHLPGSAWAPAPPLHFPSAQVFSQWQRPKCPWEKQRALRPKSCCCCPSGRGKGWAGGTTSGRTKRACRRNLSAKDGRESSAKILLEMSVPHPSPFWSAFMVMKVALSNTVWQRISEWAVTVLLILTAHVRDTENATEMLITLS